MKGYIIGHTIADIYFNYDKEELFYEFSAILQLSNGYYITEINAGPIGVDVDLIVWDEEGFQKEVRRRNSFGVDVRSFKKTRVNGESDE